MTEGFNNKIKLIAQFLAVCSSSILAEVLYRSSPFSGQSREKRRVSERHISLLIGSLQPSTNSDKLSDQALHIRSSLTHFRKFPAPVVLTVVRKEQGRLKGHFRAREPVRREKRPY